MAIPDPLNIYEGPLKTFEQWSDAVEIYWYRLLRRHVSDETARAGMRTANPMFMYAAPAAYHEYVAGWKRRVNGRNKPPKKAAVTKKPAAA